VATDTRLRLGVAILSSVGGGYPKSSFPPVLSTTHVSSRRREYSILTLAPPPSRRAGPALPRGGRGFLTTTAAAAAAASDEPSTAQSSEEAKEVSEAKRKKVTVNTACAFVGAILLNMLLGTLYCWSCYLVPLEQALGVGRGRGVIENKHSTDIDSPPTPPPPPPPTPLHPPCCLLRTAVRASTLKVTHSLISVECLFQ